jgi:uncharacterized protein with FMN-binding domain
LRFFRRIFVSAFVVVTFAAYVVHERVSNPQEQTAIALAPIATIVTPAPVIASQAPANVAADRVPPPTSIIVPTNTPSPTSAPQTPSAELPAPAPQLATEDDPTESPTQEPPTEVPTEEPPTETPTDVPPTEVPPTEVPTETPTEVPTETPTGQYKDGTYTGPEVDAYYGLVQVQAVVQNGQLANVQFLDYPHDRRTSQRINSVAVPDLQSEAIQAQSADVDIVSGATLTSRAFIESLKSALILAQS